MIDENVLTDNKLWFLLAKICGFVSLEIKENGRYGKTVEVGKCNFFFALFFQIVMQISGFIVYLHHYKFSGKLWNNNVLFIMGIVAHSTYYFCCLGICVFSFINSKQNIKFWQDLYATEVALRRINIMLNHKSLKTAVHVCTSFMVLCILPAVVVLYFDDIMNTGLTLYAIAHVNYHYRAITSMLLLFQHMLSFNVVNEMFEKLEQATGGKYLQSKERDPANRRYLLGIAKCHQMICEVARAGNRVTSIPLVLEMVQFFCCFTGEMFFTTVMFANNEYRLWILIDLMWVAIVSIISTVCIAISHTCMKKVSFLTSIFNVAFFILFTIKNTTTIQPG